MKQRLSDEELLKTLNEFKDILKEDKHLNDVDKFIRHYNIDNGTFKFSAKLVHSLYIKWTKNKVTKNDFYNEFNSTFKQYKDKKGSYYNLNLNPLDIRPLVKNRPIVDKTKSPYFKKHIESFITLYSIKKGTFNINVNVLYDLYDKWNFEILKKKQTTLTIGVFEEFLKNYFSYKEGWNITYFAIDHDILNHLTPEQKLSCLSQKGQKHAIKKENKKKSS